MSLELRASYRKSESAERRTNMLLVGVFSWDLLTFRKLWSNGSFILLINVENNHYLQLKNIVTFYMLIRSVMSTLLTFNSLYCLSRVPSVCPPAHPLPSGLCSSLPGPAQFTARGCYSHSLHT